jgi:acylphosphatase
MKADMPQAIRKRYIVKGKIQHVGYRALVMAYGESMGLKGITRNLPDKTVEVVCEGDSKAISAFLRAIDRKGDPLEPLSIDVTAIEDAPPPTEGELKDFIIDYGRELTPIEREAFDRDEIMVLGAGILNIKMDSVGKDVRSVGSSVREVGQKVDSMHTDMNTRFDHMAQRYDLIATSLVKAIDRVDAGFERMDKSSKRTDKAIEQSRKEAAASNRELAKAVNFMIRKLSDKPTGKRPAGKQKR